MKWQKVGLAVIGLAVVPLFVGACGSSSKSDTAAAGGAGENTFGLGEYTIAPPTNTMHAGTVEITANNIGGEEHELVIVRAPDVASLPTEKNGSVNEDQIAEADKVGEIEDVAAGSEKSASFDLTPGKYVAFCNVVDADMGDVHFSEGMHVAFTVS
jgi:hypothetical protein